MSSFSYMLGAFVPIFIAVIAYFLLSIGRGMEQDRILLGVCVLSARDHYDHRAAIRDTWFVAGGHDDDHNTSNRTVVKFVVGTDACPVHPDDRVDQYGCQEWTPHLFPDLERDFEAFTVEEESRIGPKVTLLSIRVMHPILLKRLGILESVPLSEEPLVVTVYADFDEEEMSSAKFSLMDPGIVHKGYRYQPVNPVLVRKICIADDVWPADMEYFTQAGVYECLDFS